MLPINAVWIDTESNFVNSMKTHLGEGDRIQHLTNPSESLLNNITWQDVDLIILELKINHTHAFELVPLIRSRKKNIPIVVITEHANKENCLSAINLGINGMMEKPVETEAFKNMINRFRSQGFELKLCQDRKAIFSFNQWVDLTSTEYKIIETLKNAQRRLTRSELQSSVWPNSSISENNLDTHLTNLKRKIPELVSCLNVKRGLGYFLEMKKAN